MDRKIKKKQVTPKRVGGLVAVTLFVVFTAYGFLKDHGLRKLKVDRQKITISTVEFGPFLEYIPVRGTVRPVRAVHLNALQSGRVAKVFVEVGSAVTAGEAILLLANQELQLQVMNEEAGLERRKEELRNGRLDMEQTMLQSRQRLLQSEYELQLRRREVERYASLSAEEIAGVMPRQDFERIKDDHGFQQRKLGLLRQTHRQDSVLAAAQVQQLEAAVARTERNLEIIRGRLDHLTLRAPISGQLTALEAELGQVKGSGEPLGQIDDLGRFKVRAALDEHYLARIGPGQRGAFDHDEETVGLTVRKVFPEVVEGRFDVDLDFVDSTRAALRVGQTVHIRLELGDLDESVQLARGGFYQSTGGKWAYVLQESGEAAVRRAIKLGRQNPRVYEVVAGLQPGERVVTSGYDNLGEQTEMLVFK